MSNIKFTPGPWRVSTSVSGNTCVTTEDFQRVCTVEWSGIKRDAMAEVISNAKLIGAAPELFNALDDVLSKTYSTNDGNYRCDMTGELFELIKSAIKKAMK